MYTEPRQVVIHRCECGKLAHPCYGRRCEECYASCQPRTRKDHELRPTNATVQIPFSERMLSPDR